MKAGFYLLIIILLLLSIQFVLANDFEPGFKIDNLMELMEALIIGTGIFALFLPLLWVASPAKAPSVGRVWTGCFIITSL